MLERVISGGQVGADQAGLFVAKRSGIPTGGTAPAGYKTHDGNQMELLRGEYGLRAEGDYKFRTWKNVEDSDGTLRLAVDFSTPGEICTKNATDHFDRPRLDVNLVRPLPPYVVKKWIKDNGIRVLNIAGNACYRGLDIHAMVVEYLEQVFKMTEKEEEDE